LPYKKLYGDVLEEFTQYNFNIPNADKCTIIEYNPICISISKNRQNNFKLLSHQFIIRKDAPNETVSIIDILCSCKLYFVLKIY